MRELNSSLLFGPFGVRDTPRLTSSAWKLPVILRMPYGARDETQVRHTVDMCPDCCAISDIPAIDLHRPQHSHRGGRDKTQEVFMSKTGGGTPHLYSMGQNLAM